MLGSFIAWIVEGAVWLSVGLLIGWNVLPQPEVVREYYDKAVAWVKAQF